MWMAGGWRGGEAGKEEAEEGRGREGERRRKGRVRERGARGLSLLSP
jgi:hypothetical protein